MVITPYRVEISMEESKSSSAVGWKWIGRDVDVPGLIIMAFVDNFREKTSDFGGLGVIRAAVKRTFRILMFRT
jgi:hypothetical protein